MAILYVRGKVSALLHNGFKKLCVMCEKVLKHILEKYKQQQQKVFNNSNRNYCNDCLLWVMYFSHVCMSLLPHDLDLSQVFLHFECFSILAREGYIIAINKLFA